MTHYQVRIVGEDLNVYSPMATIGLNISVRLFEKYDDAKKFADSTFAMGYTNVVLECLYVVYRPSLNQTKEKVELDDDMA
jgi:hypothetical protein